VEVRTNRISFYGEFVVDSTTRKQHEEVQLEDKNNANLPLNCLSCFDIRLLSNPLIFNFCVTIEIWHRNIYTYFRQYSNVVHTREYMCKFSIVITHMGHGFIYSSLRRVWRYQRGNQNPYIEEEQTTQCPREKVQKNKQRYTVLF
jgi:hypothetical protein